MNETALRVRLLAKEDQSTEDAYEEVLFERKKEILSNVSFVPSILLKRAQSLTPIAEAAGEGSVPTPALAAPLWDESFTVSVYFNERTKQLSKLKLALQQATTFTQLANVMEQLATWELDYMKGITGFFEGYFSVNEAANSREVLHYEQWKGLHNGGLWNVSWNTLKEHWNEWPEEDVKKIQREVGRCQKLLDLMRKFEEKSNS